MRLCCAVPRLGSGKAALRGESLRERAAVDRDIVVRDGCFRYAAVRFDRAEATVERVGVCSARADHVVVIDRHADARGSRSDEIDRGGGGVIDRTARVGHAVPLCLGGKGCARTRSLLLNVCAVEVADLRASRINENCILIGPIGDGTSLRRINANIAAVEMGRLPRRERDGVPARRERGRARRCRVIVALIFDPAACKEAELVIAPHGKRIAARRRRAVSVIVPQLGISTVYRALTAVRHRDIMIVLDW